MPELDRDIDELHSAGEQVAVRMGEDLQAEEGKCYANLGHRKEGLHTAEHRREENMTRFIATVGLVFALASPANAGDRTLATNVVPVNSAFPGSEQTVINAISCMIANLSDRTRPVTTRIISFDGTELGTADFEVEAGKTQPLPSAPLETGARCEFDVRGATKRWRARGCMFVSIDFGPFEISTCSEAVVGGDAD